MHGKLRFWSVYRRPRKLVKRTAEVSVHQIEIADDHCIYLDARCFAHVEKICWFTCIDE